MRYLVSDAYGARAFPTRTEAVKEAAIWKRDGREPEIRKVKK